MIDPFTMQPMIATRTPATANLRQKESVVPGVPIATSHTQPFLTCNQCGFTIQLFCNMLSFILIRSQYRNVSIKCIEVGLLFLEDIFDNPMIKHQFPSEPLSLCRPGKCPVRSWILAVVSCLRHTTYNTPNKEDGIKKSLGR